MTTNIFASRAKANAELGLGPPVRSSAYLDRYLYILFYEVADSISVSTTGLSEIRVFMLKLKEY